MTFWCVCIWKWFILPNGHSNYDDKPWDFDGTLFSDKPLAPVFYCVLSFYLGLYISLGYPRIANFRGWMIINHQNWEHPTIFRQTHIYPMKNESILTIKIRIIWAIMGNPILGIFFQYQREVHLLGVSKNEPFEHLLIWLIWYWYLFSYINSRCWFSKWIDPAILGDLTWWIHHNTTWLGKNGTSQVCELSEFVIC